MYFFQNYRYYFFSGVVIFGFLEYFVPDDHDSDADEIREQVQSPKLARSSKASPKKKSKSSLEKDQMKRTSLITFLAMGLHNLPEGLGVYLSALSDTKLGLQLAIGIMLHNVCLVVFKYLDTRRNGSRNSIVWSYEFIFFSFILDFFKWFGRACRSYYWRVAFISLSQS